MLLAILFVAILVFFEVTHKENKLEKGETSIRRLDSGHRNAA
jgi:hypothetical protein